MHVGTNLNSAVTEVPTKRRRRGTVWHHRGGAHGTTAAPRRHYGGGAHVPELSKGHCCLGCMQVVFRNGLVERILSFVWRGKNSCPNFWLNGHLKFCTVSWTHPRLYYCEKSAFANLLHICIINSKKNFLTEKWWVSFDSWKICKQSVLTFRIKSVLEILTPW